MTFLASEEMADNDQASGSGGGAENQWLHMCEKNNLELHQDADDEMEEQLPCHEEAPVMPRPSLTSNSA